MAKKSEEGLSILDMDFGDFINPDDDFLTPPLPDNKEEPVEEPVEQPVEQPVEEEEEDKLDVNAALSGVTEEEEEEEEDAPDKEKEIDETEPPASSDDEPFTLVLARYQLEQGVLSSLDEDKLKEIIESDGEAAAFSYLIQSEVESNSKVIEERLDEYSKEYADLRKAGFSSQEAGNTILTLEALDSITEDDIQDEANEELRRTILKENYKATTSFSESKIDRLVKRAFDINADVEDSVEALESLKEARKTDLAAEKQRKVDEQKAAQDAYNQQIAELSKHIESLDEIVPGKKINKQTKSKIKDIITKPVKQSEEGYAMNAMWAKRNENPVEFDSILAYLYLSGVFDGKWDQITKTVNTQLTKKLQTKINSGSGSSLMGGKPTTRREDEVAQRRKDLLGSMRHLLED